MTWQGRWNAGRRAKENVLFANKWLSKALGSSEPPPTCLEIAV